MFGEHVPSYRKFRAFSYPPHVRDRSEVFGGRPPGLQGVFSSCIVGGGVALLGPQKTQDKALNYFSEEELHLRRGHFHADDSRPVLNSRSHKDYKAPMAWLRNE